MSIAGSTVVSSPLGSGWGGASSPRRSPFWLAAPASGVHPSAIVSVPIAFPSLSVISTLVVVDHAVARLMRAVGWAVRASPAVSTVRCCAPYGERVRHQRKQEDSPGRTARRDSSSRGVVRADGAGGRVSGGLSGRVVQNLLQAHRSVPRVLDGEITVAPGRTRRAVQVAVDVHGVRWHPAQGRVGEDEDRVGVADEPGVLPVETGGRQLRAGEEVMVPEDELPRPGAAGDVQPKPAVVAPGIGVGDVAQTDDGLAEAYAPAPLGQQRAVHVPDAPERPVPGLDDRAVAEVEVGPDPRPAGVRV